MNKLTAGKGREQRSELFDGMAVFCSRKDTQLRREDPTGGLIAKSVFLLFKRNCSWHMLSISLEESWHFDPTSTIGAIHITYLQEALL